VPFAGASPFTALVLPAHSPQGSGGGWLPRLRLGVWVRARGPAPVGFPCSTASRRVSGPIRSRSVDMVRGGAGGSNLKSTTG